MYSVYCHQNKINGKKYFGITCKVPKYRWGRDGHEYAPYYFGRAVAKYGWDNFEHIILYSGLNKETAIMFEKYLIAEFNTQNDIFGYNLTSGGDGVESPTEEVRRKLSENNKGKHNPSAETRAKISKANKGKVMSAEARAKISKNSASRRPEVRAKMSASRKGIPNVNKGRKFTEEEKAILYASRRGRHRPLSDEAKAKLSAWHTGRKLSEETKAKVSASLKGKKPWNKGLKGIKTKAQLLALQQETDPNE